jgi:hypothetical protein
MVVECVNVAAAIIGIGMMCAGVGDDDDEGCVMSGKVFIARLVGAVTACLFIALVFDPFCILYFGTTKTITMKHAYLLFWLILITLGVLLLLGVGQAVTELGSEASRDSSKI